MSTQPLLSETRQPFNSINVVTPQSKITAACLDGTSLYVIDQLKQLFIYDTTTCELVGEYQLPVSDEINDLKQDRGIFFAISNTSVLRFTYVRQELHLESNLFGKGTKICPVGNLYGFISKHLVTIFNYKEKDNKGEFSVSKQNYCGFGDITHCQGYFWLVAVTYDRSTRCAGSDSGLFQITENAQCVRTISLEGRYIALHPFQNELLVWSKTTCRVYENGGLSFAKQTETSMGACLTDDGLLIMTREQFILYNRVGGELEKSGHQDKTSSLVKGNARKKMLRPLFGASVYNPLFRRMISLVGEDKKDIFCVGKKGVVKYERI